ncbi:MAG TPA: bifunctional DNA primase/polymerase [Anaerolineae bacterium]|nr:bifunctional DNA primase/polymerase [Anaerolineae bacterium]
MALCDIALQYHAWGANVTAIGGSPDLKRPAHKWQQFEAARQTVSAVRGLPWQGYTRRDGARVEITGVGFISGVGGWRDLDFDKCPGFTPVAQALTALGLPEDYSWVQRTGSGNGWQIIFRCSTELPPGALTAKAKEPGVFVGASRNGSFEHLELRWSNCQSLLPPSQHQSGGIYQWRGGEPLGPPSAVGSPQVLAAFSAVAQLVARPEPPPPHAAGPGAESGGSGKRAGVEPTATAYNEPGDRGVIDAIHEHFDLLAYARQHFPGEQQRQGDEVRITGHGGLLLKPEAGVWFCHRETIGGDWLDLVGYRQHGVRWERQDKEMFRAALREAAAFAGIPLPRGNGRARGGVAHTATLPGAAAGQSVSAAVSVSDQEELAQAGPERAGGSDGRDVRRVADGVRAVAAAPPDTSERRCHGPAEPVTTALPAETGPSPAAPMGVEALLAALSVAGGRDAVMEQALGLTGAAAHLDRNGQLRVERLLPKLGVAQEFVRQWRAAVNDARQRTRHGSARQPVTPDPPAPLPNSWPYEAANGRLWKLSRTVTTTGDESINRDPICDFTACVVAEEVTVLEGQGDLEPDQPRHAEEPGRWFYIKGTTQTGRPFTVQLSAATLSDPRALRAALLGAIGTEGVIYPKMDLHLAVALLKCTPAPPRIYRRQPHLGWSPDGVFLIPGRLPPDVTLAVASDAPYRLEPDADLATALKALAALLRAHDQRRTTIAALAAFTPPLAGLVGWRKLRYALFIAGVTGSLKSSWCMALMGIWGRRFTAGHGFVKFGEKGGSVTAVLGAAALAHDLTLLIDNYKPQIAGARSEFTALLAALIEGDDKLRMERSGERMRKTRELAAWPLFTGEDVPGDDASTVARCLVVPFVWEPGQPNPALSEAQNLAEHLTAVGRVWLDWLASAEGQAAAQLIVQSFPGLRDQWLAKLSQLNPQMRNPARLASNLAINQLTYWAVCQQSELRTIFKPHEAAHLAGLNLIAEEMGIRTQESSESERFLAALRELVGRDEDDQFSYVLLRRDALPSSHDRERLVGWYDDRGLYLLPGRAREIVEKARGRDYLGNLSDQTLHAQLARQGQIASSEKGRHLQQIRVRGSKPRVLHLKTTALFPAEPDPPAPHGNVVG